MIFNNNKTLKVDNGRIFVTVPVNKKTMPQTKKENIGFNIVYWSIVFVILFILEIVLPKHLF